MFVPAQCTNTPSSATKHLFRILTPTHPPRSGALGHSCHLAFQLRPRCRPGLCACNGAPSCGRRLLAGLGAFHRYGRYIAPCPFNQDVEWGSALGTGFRLPFQPWAGGPCATCTDRSLVLGDGFLQKTRFLFGERTIFNVEVDMFRFAYRSHGLRARNGPPSYGLRLLAGLGGHEWTR